MASKTWWSDTETLQLPTADMQNYRLASWSLPRAVAVEQALDSRAGANDALGSSSPFTVRSSTNASGGPLAGNCKHAIHAKRIPADGEQHDPCKPPPPGLRSAFLGFWRAKGTVAALAERRSSRSRAMVRLSSSWLVLSYRGL
jgi:hypothetical protein